MLFYYSKYQRSMPFGMFEWFKMLRMASQQLNWMFTSYHTSQTFFLNLQERRPVGTELRRTHASISYACLR